MEKFFNIRNVLIILIILISAIYIVFMRSKNPENSKTSDLYYQLINKDKVTLKLSYSENDKHGTIIFSTDKNSNKTCQILELYNNSKQAKENNTTHIKNITIIENKTKHTYQLNYDLNSYIDFGKIEYNNDITDWIDNINRIVSRSKYYTKGYKNINNTRMFTENFPEQGYTFYYDSNDLKYIKQKDGFSGNENTLYEIKLNYDFIDNSLLEIPNNFTQSN